MNLCIKNDFVGNIIGKKNNKVRIEGNFSGVISCDILVCKSNSKINGDLFVNHLTVDEGVTLEGETTLGKLIYESKPLQLAEIANLSPADFIGKH